MGVFLRGWHVIPSLALHRLVCKISQVVPFTHSGKTTQMQLVNWKHYVCVLQTRRTHTIHTLPSHTCTWCAAFPNPTLQPLSFRFFRLAAEALTFALPMGKPPSLCLQPLCWGLPWGTLPTALIQVSCYKAVNLRQTGRQNGPLRLPDLSYANSSPIRGQDVLVHSESPLGNVVPIPKLTLQHREARQDGQPWVARGEQSGSCSSPGSFLVPWTKQKCSPRSLLISGRPARSNRVAVDFGAKEDHPWCLLVLSSRSQSRIPSTPPAPINRRESVILSLWNCGIVQGDALPECQFALFRDTFKNAFKIEMWHLIFCFCFPQYGQFCKNNKENLSVSLTFSWEIRGGKDWNLKFKLDSFLDFLGKYQSTARQGTKNSGFSSPSPACSSLEL